ncbi:UNVERIFIED_ORG: hypothetical protein JN05_03498 [Zoogloea ramigera]|uniref:Uncharacterized protein n=1 Tax=Duganella zoogloeoides TaxID=75659 RepID=A0ABZ0Y092_9BURK|nr:hypothetical protein [Duganella zoogloeoides]WQH05440.1 hypothetical protein SR858_03620 [Duganella zoogloeoides]
MVTNLLNNEEFVDARAGLLLPLGPDDAPFELVGDEPNLGPDDWAWIFLSMNEDYRDAYDMHAGEEDLDLASELVGQHIAGIKRDSDGTCAARFGLAAWVPPSLSNLPKFANSGDSWFFPLKRPVSEDYRRKEVSSAPYSRTWTPYSPKFDRYRHILSNETLFGYRRPPHVPFPDSSPTSTWSIIWVAIDCSSPPAGQISALRTLASALREKLKSSDWPENDASGEYGVFDIAGSDAFDHMHFNRASSATSDVADLKTVWRAVQIDALGPIVTQLDFLLKALNEIHRDLIAKGLATAPLYERFKNSLPKTEDSDGSSRSGGKYIKALVILAELSKWGHDTRRISQITIGPSVGNRYSHNWKRVFEESIEDYIAQADQMIHGGYRLLIHTQRPNR